LDSDNDNTIAIDELKERRVPLNVHKRRIGNDMHREWVP